MQKALRLPTPNLPSIPETSSSPTLSTSSTMSASSYQEDNPKSPPQWTSQKEDEEETSKSWEWYEPDQNGTFAEYCSDSSMHGIQFIAQEGRHMFERIFWFLACLAVGIYGGIFIYKMWDEYVDMPVITVFNPTEKSLKEIPFPAVTICNVNNIRRSKLNQLVEKIQNGGNSTSPEYLRTLAAVMDVEHICESKKTFSERFIPKPIPSFRQDENISQKLEEFKQSAEKLMSPTRTLREGSQACHEMILFCLWMDQRWNCSELFQEIETDFGSCCTFNMIPASLLLKYADSEKSRDDPKRVERWKASGHLDYDNILFNSEEDDRPYPRRQLYPGRAAGLSFLVDPDLQEYDCTNTDSEGFIISVHAPLDYPNMRDNDVIAIPTSSEIFIGVRPEVTISEEAIMQYPLDKRRCYFSKELELSYYTKYSSSNCQAECIAGKTYAKCKCKKHFMPRKRNETLCNSSQQNLCTETVKKSVIRKGTDKECAQCMPTCTEVDYHTETTYLGIRQKSVNNLAKEYPNLTHSLRNSSIVNIYFNVHAVYPRLRKEMTTMVDLISNAGGLLGFTMGFSILSVLEIVWFVTFRLCFKMYRKKGLEPKKEKKLPFYGGDGGGWRHVLSNYKFLIIGGVFMIVVIVGSIYLRNWISAKIPSS